MIDPDGIVLTTQNLPSFIKLEEVPEYDYITYDLEDEKSFKKYISDIESAVRQSYEYRLKLTPYLRKYYRMSQCAYFQNANNSESNKIRIEIHHYPLTLYDICLIVYKKRKYYGESLGAYMVAKEVAKLHFQAMVGLIPLSITVHKLTHNGKLFIGTDRVFGRFDLFMEFYDPFITPEQKDTVARMEKYTAEESGLLNRTILNENHVILQIQDPTYQLPDTSSLNNQIKQRIAAIKDNGYQLPNVRDEAHQPPAFARIEERKAYRSPIFFDENLKEKYNDFPISA